MNTVKRARSNAANCRIIIVGTHSYLKEEERTNDGRVKVAECLENEDRPSPITSVIAKYGFPSQELQVRTAPPL